MASVEWLSNRRNVRGKFLLHGLRDMLDPLPRDSPETSGSDNETGATRETAEIPSTSADVLDGSGVRRSTLERLASEGERFSERLRAAPKGTFRPDESLADLVLAHP